MLYAYMLEESKGYFSVCGSFNNHHTRKWITPSSCLIHQLSISTKPNVTSKPKTHKALGVFYMQTHLSISLNTNETANCNDEHIEQSSERPCITLKLPFIVVQWLYDIESCNPLQIVCGVSHKMQNRSYLWSKSSSTSSRTPIFKCIVAYKCSNITLCCQLDKEMPTTSWWNSTNKIDPFAFSNLSSQFHIMSHLWESRSRGYFSLV